jgi:hypothetical protein
LSNSPINPPTNFDQRAWRHKFADLSGTPGLTSSLSDLKNRSEKVTGRGQILTILKANSRSIARKSGEICTVQMLLQPICFKSDRLLGIEHHA